jgi:hypothetical protein
MGLVVLKTMAALAKSLMLPYVGVMERSTPKLDVLLAALRKIADRFA